MADPDTDEDHVGTETDLGRRVLGAWTGGKTLNGSGELEPEESEEDAVERRRRNVIWYVLLFRPGYGVLIGGVVVRRWGEEGCW